METKNEIRKHFSTLRNSVSDKDKTVWSDQILKRLVNTKEWKESTQILVYADFKNEVMTDKIILYAISEGKDVYTPKVCGNNMVFYRIHSLEDLHSGAWGIREPLEHAENKFIVTGNGISLCITPGLSFSLNGQRLGYGKGYYDRFFKENNIRHKVGVAYSFQICDTLPQEKTDEKVNLIVTEKQIFKI